MERFRRKEERKEVRAGGNRLKVLDLLMSGYDPRDF